MTPRRTCPCCEQRTLLVKRGLGGLLLLCSAGCTREAIITALEEGQK